jgi:ABC-type uncharacterized transport system involved in gliding motility auxiliary subunit
MEGIKMGKSFLTKRSTRFGSVTFIYIIIILGILVFINFISVRRHHRFDLTKNKRFSLSEQSAGVLDNLTDKVKILAFFKKGDSVTFQYKDLLNEYAYKNKNFTYEVVDPDRNPVMARNYGIEEYGTTVVLYQDKTERFTGIDEGDLTNAILKAAKKEVKKLYFLSGHGEPDIDESGDNGFAGVKKALGHETYLVEKIVLAQAENVPSDAAVLIIAGPKKALFSAELEKLTEYIQKGGSVLFMIDPMESRDIKEFVKEWDIEVGDDIIIDQLSKLFGAGYTTPVVSQYEKHEITGKFKYATFFPLARSVKPLSGQKKGCDILALAKTSPSSWAETDYENEEVEYNQGKDMAGPVPLAVAAEITLDKTEEEEKAAISRMVVFGDSDFARNQFLPLSGNRDLFLNTVNWLAGEEDLITIRPKEAEISNVSLTRSEGINLFFLSVAFYPAVILAAGIVVWSKRRK